MQDQIPIVPIILALFAIVAVILFVAMLAFIVFLMSRAAKCRSYDSVRGREMGAAARQIGFVFTPQADLGSLPFFADFELFEVEKLDFENLMTGSSRGHQVAIFDLVYRNIGNVGAGTTTSRQTMAVLVSDDLLLPVFYLRPEGTFEKVLNTLSRVEINFPERPRFSSQFLLYGDDEPAIRKLFKPSILDHFEQNPQLCVAGSGKCLYFYTSRTLASPAQVGQYLAFVEQLDYAFRQ